MATIKKQGSGYKITVSNGYNIAGKQLRTYTTWTPQPGMTLRQIEKELNRQAVLFEEAVKAAGVHDANMRFMEFVEVYMRDYARPNLKAQTVYNYERHLATINKAIGHLKLKDIRAGHLNAFYANLREDGIRAKEFAVATFDMKKWIREAKTTQPALAKEAGVSVWAVRQAVARKPIAKESAAAIARRVGKDMKEVFRLEKDVRPLSGGTIATYHRVISSVLTRAVKWGYLQRNTAELAEAPSASTGEAAFLDEPDARRMLDLLADEPVRWRSVVTFDLLSGLRRGELLGLRWEDVDFDAQLIHIRQTHNYVPKKGTYTDTPKSRKSSRVFRISRSAILLLRAQLAWQEEQGELLGDAWDNEDGRVFVNDFGRPTYPGSITQWFSAFVARSGLPKVTVHSLRHTFATLMISDGIPLVVVSKDLGHAQVSTTNNIYAHVIASAEARAAQTFDRFDDILISDNKRQINANPPSEPASGE